jgi:hypothetical protein
MGTPERHAYLLACHEITDDYVYYDFTSKFLQCSADCAIIGPLFKNNVQHEREK